MSVGTAHGVGSGGASPRPVDGAGVRAGAGGGGAGGVIRVLVVDDSAVIRRVLSEMIASDAGLKVIDTAKNGEEAVAKALALRPDVITLDVEMPVLDGISALRRIRRQCPEPRPLVLMCSSLTKSGSHEALRAMCAGASDVICKPNGDSPGTIAAMKEELIAKIKAIASGRRRASAVGARAGGKGAADAPTVQVATKPMSLKGMRLDLLMIGSSTGGPPVLETVLRLLPADLPAPVVIAQHMPPVFTRSMAERLDAGAMITVVEGENGMPLYNGVAYVIPGGQHGRVRASGMGKLVLEVSPDPPGLLYKPCVNELLASGARVCGGRTLAAVLTGMGDDGKLGATEVKAKGGVVLAQSPESCVVYGMPRAVVDAGLASAVMTPGLIGETLASLSPSYSAG